MDREIKFPALLHSIAQVYNIPCFVFDSSGALVERYGASLDNAEFLLSFSNFKARLLQARSQPDKPQVISSELGQLWAGIPVIDEKLPSQLIVLGPVFTSGGATNIMLEYVRSYNISSEPREKMLAALNTSAICPYTEFTRLVALIYGFIYQSELDTSELPITGLIEHDVPAFLLEEVEEPRSAGVTKEDKSNFMFDDHLLEAIRAGSVENLKRVLRTSNYSNMRYIRHPDPIRQQKNMFIGLLTQLVRIATSAGLDPEAVYSLADLYAGQVEAMKNLNSIVTLTREMLYDFTTRIGRLKHTRQYSALVNDCCNYIHAHVSASLSVSGVAAHTGFNAHYLSRRFRTETGKSIGDYIRDAKIDEAKTLLKYSDLSLAQIGEQLAFSSQSFFTYTFRCVTGLTPRQYREQAAKEI